MSIRTFEAGQARGVNVRHNRGARPSLSVSHARAPHFVASAKRTHTSVCSVAHALCTLSAHHNQGHSRQQLRVARHGMVQGGEHALHQRIPIGDAAGGVVALVAVGR